MRSFLSIPTRKLSRPRRDSNARPPRFASTSTLPPAIVNNDSRISRRVFCQLIHSVHDLRTRASSHLKPFSFSSGMGFLFVGPSAIDDSHETRSGSGNADRTRPLDGPAGTGLTHAAMSDFSRHPLAPRYSVASPLAPFHLRGLPVIAHRSGAYGPQAP